MENRQSISVIICTWNRAASLQATLHSLSEQKGCENLDIEIIVIDNNSTDDTKAMVNDILPFWRLGKLRYAFEPRQGKQFALNHGITIAHGEILAFTDDDILFSTDWLCNIASVFNEEAVELAGGKTLLIWPDSGKPGWYDLSMMATVAGVDLGDLKCSPPPPEYAPAGSNMCARGSLFSRVGGFSETHFRHMDYEFGQRCVRLGVNIAYVPSLVVYAPVAPACLTKRYFRRWSFKAGIAYDGKPDASSAMLFSVPRWVYRMAFDDLIFLIFRSHGVAEPVVFNHELRLWRCVGMIASRWYSKYFPGRYSKWVERCSQKKRNLY